MQITIKRKDSVTSILLFLFNVFLVDRGITSLPIKKIFQLLEPFQKNETAIRMGLSREIQNGVLTNRREAGEVVYGLTQTALAGFKYWMKTMDHNQQKIRLQYREWDGWWRLLFFSKEAEIQSDSDNFYDLLKQFGFGSLNRNVWLSPYNYQEEIIRLARESKGAPQFHFFESRLTDENGRQDLVAEVWPIVKLNESYRQFLALIEERTQNSDYNAYRGGGGLPVLHRIGLEFFEIVREDPHLPKEILPEDWLGFKAALVFKNLRDEILPKANQFISHVLER